MNVGIQETEHFEGVYPVIRLFDNGSNQLFLFVNQEVYVRLCDLLGESAQNYHWIIQENKEPTWSFCRKIRKTILQEDIQLVYLNTISKHHIWYALLLPFRQITYSILTVHDVNCLFRDHLRLSPRSWVKYLGKKMLAKKVSAFNTVSETVAPYLRKQASARQQVYTVPGAVYEQEKKTIQPDKYILVVVPGSIDHRRRDYEAVLQFAEIIRGMQVRICLLGGGQTPYAKSIWQQCQIAENPQLTWFETATVNQVEFDQWLDDAHFIWIPSIIETCICDRIPETYGVTKSSGNIFDIIKHAKPFLYPQRLEVPDQLKGNGQCYNSLAELKAFLSLLLTDQFAYSQLSKAAEQASGHFTIVQLRKKYFPLFDHLPGNLPPND